jgi:hypothetical protein
MVTQKLKDISIKISENLLISDNPIDFQVFEDKIEYWIELIGEKYLLMLQVIYAQSIIDIDNFYKSVAILTYKTNNSQKDICKLAYWKFTNLLAYINEIIEQENKSNKDGGDAKGAYSDMKGQASKTMSGMKSITPKVSMPRI